MICLPRYHNNGPVVHALRAAPDAALCRFLFAICMYSKRQIILARHAAVCPAHPAAYKCQHSTHYDPLNCCVLQAGFDNPRVLEAQVIDVHDSELKALLGDAQFYSITFR